MKISAKHRQPQQCDGKVLSNSNPVQLKNTVAKGEKIIMKRLCLVVSAAVWLIFSGSALATSTEFLYGFVGEQPESTPYVIENGATLRSGQTFKLNFQFTTGNWFYVAHLSGDGNYALLYGSSTGAYGKNQFSFDTLEELTLDQSTGEEIFTLIASEERLEALESLFEQYGEASAASKRRFGKRIASALADLHKLLEEPEAAELVQRLDAPIMGGVAFRSVATDEAIQHSLIHKATGDRIAEATFVIKHQ